MQTQTSDSETYNGWANQPTWNISLWISNDENVYAAASVAVDTLNRRGTLNETITPEWAKAFCRISFVDTFGREQTPDGTNISDQSIDWSAIADMIKELA
jgi:hypothetical protein